MTGYFDLPTDIQNTIFEFVGPNELLDYKLYPIQHINKKPCAWVYLDIDTHDSLRKLHALTTTHLQCLASGVGQFLPNRTIFLLIQAKHKIRFSNVLKQIKMLGLREHWPPYIHRCFSEFQERDYIQEVYIKNLPPVSTVSKNYVLNLTPGHQRWYNGFPLAVMMLSINRCFDLYGYMQSNNNIFETIAESCVHCNSHGNCFCKSYYPPPFRLRSMQEYVPQRLMVSVSEKDVNREISPDRKKVSLIRAFYSFPHLQMVDYEPDYMIFVF